MPQDKKKKEEELFGEEGKKMAKGIEAVFGGSDEDREKEKEETKKASAYLSRSQKASGYLGR